MAEEGINFIKCKELLSGIEKCQPDFGIDFSSDRSDCKHRQDYSIKYTDT